MESPDSIQAILRRRRGAAFVGRADQLTLFRENFAYSAGDDRKTFVFNVHGEGGIGKSTLLERWSQIAGELGAVTARVDEHVFGVPEAMSLILDQLGDQRKAKAFRARYADYLNSRERLESDPQAPRELWSQVIRTSVKAGLHASKAIPGAAPVVELVDGDTAADAVDQVRQFLVGKFRDSKQIRLLLSPTEELSTPFVSALAESAEDQPVVLFFDTYEQTSAFLEDWLLALFSATYGDLPSAVTTVVAGRLPLDTNRWTELRDLVTDVPLRPFTEAESHRLLAAQGVTEPRTVETILALSGGLPLLTDMLAKSRPATAAAVGDPSDTAVERFLKWEPDPSRRRAALAGALPRWVDEDLVSAIADPSIAPALFEWLTGQAFVRLHAHRYRYHDVVRGPMIRWQRQRSPQRWREDHLRMAEVFRTRRDRTSATADWADTAWLDNHVELAYHQLCGQEATLNAVLGDAVEALTEGTAVARRWAEMMVEAGQDSGDSATHDLGTRLLAASGDDADGIRFLSVLLASGKQDKVSRARTLVERARLLYFANRDEEAVRDCTEAIRLNACLAGAYGVRAAARSFLGNHEEALTDFAESLRIDPDNFWTLSRRGYAYISMKRYAHALTDLDRALELNPTSSWAFATRGRVHRAAERYEDAVADLTRSIELDATDSWALSVRGEIFQDMERYDDALADQHRALELDPRDAWLNAARGETHRVLKRHDAAIADLTRAIELDPRLAWAYGQRGATLRDLARYDEAVADLTHALELEPTYLHVHSWRGQIYHDTSRYDDALADRTRVVELSDGADWAIADRGDTYRALGRFDEAIADFSRALELDPDYDWALAHRGETYRLMGRLEEAITDLDRATALDPAYVWAIAVRGQVHQGAKRYDDALADFTRAVDLNAEYDWALGQRGETYRLLGRHREAIADLDRAVELNPASAWVLATRGQCYRALNEPGEALTDFDRAIVQDPRLDWAYAERGDTFRLLDRHGEALENFDRAVELDPADASYLVARAITKREMGLADQAAADLDRAAELMPGLKWTLVGRLLEFEDQ